MTDVFLFDLDGDSAADVAIFPLGGDTARGPEADVEAATGAEGLQYAACSGALVLAVVAGGAVGTAQTLLHGVGHVFALDADPAPGSGCDTAAALLDVLRFDGAPGEAGRVDGLAGLHDDTGPLPAGADVLTLDSLVLVGPEGHGFLISADFEGDVRVLDF